VVAKFDGLLQSFKATSKRCCLAMEIPGRASLLSARSRGRPNDRQGKPFVGVSGQLLDRMLPGLASTEPRSN